MTTDAFDLMTSVPDAPSGLFRNYGKLTITPIPLDWRSGSPVEVTPDVWRTIPDKENGKNAKGMRFVFSVDLQELKPALGFAYSRNVNQGDADWNKTLAPSLETLFGKGSMSKENAPATMRKIQGQYVAIEDVPQQPRKNEKLKADGTRYGTIKFVVVFPSREACAAALAALSPASKDEMGFGDTPIDPMIPSAYSKEDWASVRDEIVQKLNIAMETASDANAKKPKPLQAKAIADAKTATLKVLESEYAASAEQILKLIA